MGFSKITVRGSYVFCPAASIENDGELICNKLVSVAHLKTKYKIYDCSCVFRIFTKGNIFLHYFSYRVGGTLPRIGLML